MRPNGRKRDTRRRETLFKQQRGLCFWCDEPMLPTSAWKANSRHPMPASLCTLDHLDDRLNPLRGRFAKMVERTVAACARCNNERSNGGDRATVIEAKRLADGGYIPAAVLAEIMAPGPPIPASYTAGDPRPVSPFEVLRALAATDRCVEIVIEQECGEPNDP